jgi:hypothetical protein
MTENELRRKYTTAYRIIRKERAMRDHVFPPGNEKRADKLAEMDELLTILMEFKNALKAQIGSEQEQMALLPPPVRYE